MLKVLLISYLIQGGVMFEPMPRAIRARPLETPGYRQKEVKACFAPNYIESKADSLSPLNTASFSEVATNIFHRLPRYEVQNQFDSDACHSFSTINLLGFYFDQYFNSPLKLSAACLFLLHFLDHGLGREIKYINSFNGSPSKMLNDHHGGSGTIEGDIQLLKRKIQLIREKAGIDKTNTSAANENSHDQFKQVCALLRKIRFVRDIQVGKAKTNQAGPIGELLEAMQESGYRELADMSESCDFGAQACQLHEFLNKFRLKTVALAKIPDFDSKKRKVLSQLRKGPLGLSVYQYDALSLGKSSSLCSTCAHSVLLVGYSKEKDIFYVKNSWGSRDLDQVDAKKLISNLAEFQYFEETLGPDPKDFLKSFGRIL